MELDDERLSLLRRAFIARQPEELRRHNRGEPLTQWFADELEAHLVRRPREFYDYVVPWLASNTRIQGAHVLEVGTGTGASTLALLQHGASVVGIDIDAEALGFARQRLDAYGHHSTTLAMMNATDISSLGQRFDLIVFFAAFEHMTYDERQASLKAAWNIRRPGGKIAIVECPNRLWYFDAHTTLANFSHWLPDQVAIDYARFVKRSDYSESMQRDWGGDLPTRLARWGRGGSYHELEIAIAPLHALRVGSGLMDYRRSLDQQLDAWWTSSIEGRYRELMMKVAEDIPPAFFYPWLDVVVGEN